MKNFDLIWIKIWYKLNFDLIENGVRLDLVDDECTVVYRSKAIY